MLNPYREESPFATEIKRIAGTLKIANEESNVIRYGDEFYVG